MLREEHVEILVEEASMTRFLDQMLPEILPHGYVLGQNCFVRPHNKKSDLMKSLPRKARGFQYFPQPVRMVVIHEQDSKDCYLLKEYITEQVQGENPTIPLLVRIAGCESENWYLGDLDAIEKVYPESRAASQKTRLGFECLTISKAIRK